MDFAVLKIIIFYLNTSIYYSNDQIANQDRRSRSFFCSRAPRTIKFWEIDLSECLKTINLTVQDIYCFLFTKNEDIVVGSPTNLVYLTKEFEINSSQVWKI